MSFNTNGQEVKKGGLSKGLSAGVVYASVHSSTLRVAGSGKKQLQFTLVGPDLPDFEGWDIERNNPSAGKYKGQSATVSATIYVDETVFNSTDVNTNPILNRFVVIAEELAMRDQLNAIEANDLESWVEAATALIKGHALYFFLVGNEEYYNGKLYVKLSLPRYKFASADDSKLDVFDKSNKYHYRVAENAPVKNDVTDFSTEEVPFDV